MAMEITQFLLAAQSADANIRNEAEANLRQFQQQNLPVFLLSLSVELANDEKPTESRRLAGIVLKNSLDAKDATTKEALVKQWLEIDISFKSQVKDSLLRTLASPVLEARHTSAQVVAKIASIEIPQKQWPELIQSLLNYMTRQDSPAALKQATLETLGYVCEEISHQDLVQDEVNAVLTAVVQGMNLAEHSAEVRLAATRALYNALDFAQTNIQNEMERNYIMKVVCETAKSKEVEIRQTAFECLVSIASTYYEVLEPYMQTLFELTSNAVKGDEEPVALQAVEFWSSICDEEIELQEFENPESGDSASSNYHFIEKARSSLVPMLLETLLKQEEDQDQDDSIWNISMAGGTCLGLVARTVGDEIVPLVMPFVEANIVKPDWRCREAATYAFGSILEGPTIDKLAPLVHAGLEFLLNAMRDENNHVKDTTAWTLSRIFELLHCPDTGFTVISTENLQRILTVLLESIKDAPNVAEKVCGALYYLAQGYEDAGPNSSLLSPYLTSIIAELLRAADRTDDGDSKLRSAAYETLNEVIRCSNITETSQIIAELLPAIMGRLGQTLELQIVSSDDREKQGDLQASLCGVLQVIIQKFSSTDATKSVILQAADQIMVLFLRVFACRSSTVHEEAMLAIGALAYATGPEFAKYMPEFYQYVQMGLQNSEEYQVCAITVGVVGDICRALDDKVLPYCDGIMSLLLNALSSSQLHRSVKPPILSCFGDIALAIGVHFEKYVPHALQMMQEAAKACAQLDMEDEELMDYGNQLRSSIFEAYSGILQGFKNARAEVMTPYAQHLLQLIELVFRDSQRDECVTKAAVAVMGDLADALGPNTKLLFKDCSFCVNGIGATPEGNIPFLDLFDINKCSKERIWESDKEKYFETTVALLSDQTEGDLYLNQLKILTSKESKTENTQYYIQSWPDRKSCQITDFPHPYPQLALLQKELIKYQRKDGVQLTATLYLPPGYDPLKDGPLPCLFWSYPGEFKSKDAAGQVRGSPNEFPGIGPTSVLLWLTRRFAILSGPTTPIIGEGDEEANDRFVEQLVASAEAAVEEVVRRGVAHPSKIAVGGHSYGAFMTGNLLAHAPHLFCCGIARSGAYNRTLTPFGFQNEDRTLWEATSTYVEMSPFMSANKIKKPILLIHGEEDNNPGTLTMQSDRFFNALKGHGALCRLVILPFESHGYAARESIMHLLWETDRWLQKFCVSNTADVSADLKVSEDDESKCATDSQNKTVAASEGQGS